MILVDLDRVTMTRPGRPLFDDLSLTVSDTDRIGIVGINGGGKSTLLRVITGDHEPESGSVRRGRGVSISSLDQAPHFDAPNLREALTDGAPEDDWESIAIADRLGLSPLLDKPIGELSGGQVKRAALAQLLVTKSDLLVLDEPTNHLDIDAIAWLEDRLAEHRGGLILVTHDRHFLDRVTNRIVELDRGKAFLHDGGYGAYLEGRARREEMAATTEQKRRNLARTELAWLRRGAPARTAKPKARVESAKVTVGTKAEAAARSGQLPLHSQVPRLGDKVIELRGVGAGYPGQPPLFENVELLLDNRERLGIVGPNGTGKSTLLDLMAGLVEPLSGTIEVGPTVRIGYYDQRGRELDPKQRVRDAVAGDKGDVDWTDKALMEAFWFDGDTQWAPIELLSGGERRRLQLLLTLAEKPNVLLLDEPTNDLDLDTLRELEDFLEDWPGALVAVSHDRAFLERTVADVIVMDATRGLGRLPGGYAAYEQDRRLRRNRHSVGRAAKTNAPGVAGPSPVRGGTPGRGRARPASGPSVGGPSTAAPPADGTSDGGERLSSSTVRFRLKAADKALKSAQKTLAGLRAEFEASLDDHVRLGEVAAQVAEAEEKLDKAEEIWLELATLAEEVGFKI